MSPRRRSPTSTERRPKRSRLLRALHFAARITGWLGVLVGITLVAIDRAGWATWQVERELQRRLGALGATITIGQLDFDWLGPGVEVEGLQLDQSGRTLFRADRLYIAIGFTSSEGVYLSRLDLDGGRVLICDPLIDDLEVLFALGEAPEVTEETGFPDLQLPSIQVRDFLVEFEDPARKKHSLGRVDFSMIGHSDRPSPINGRLSLPPRDGAIATPELFLNGLASPDGLLELHSTAHELDLASWNVPAILPLQQIREMQPTGKLSLHTSGSVSLRGTTSARGRVRFALHGGSLALPIEAPAVEQLNFDFDATYSGAGDATFWDPEAWSGSGKLGANWAGQALRGGLRLGRAARPGRLLESWVQAPTFQVDIPELQGLSEPWLLRNIFDSFDPHGVVQATFGLQCLEGWTPGGGRGPDLEIAARVVSNASLQASFHGWRPREEPEMIPLSFPLPMHAGEGKVVYSMNARFPRRELIDVEFTLEQPDGSAWVVYQEWTNPIDLPPFAPGFGKRESDLLIDVPRIDLEDHVREYIQGLGQIPPLRTLFDDYGLQGGWTRVKIRLASRAETPDLSVRVTAELADVTGTWAQIPIPFHDVEGMVEVIDDGRGGSAVRFNAEGRTEGCEGLAMEGRARFTREEGKERSRVDLDVIRLVVDTLDFEGAVARTVSDAIPAIGDGVSELGPRGRASVEMVRTVGENGTEERIGVEVVMEKGTTLTPKAFPVQAGEILGRVIVTVESRIEPEGGPDGGARIEPESSLVLVAPIVGRWREELPVAFHASFPTPGDGTGRVIGAGLRPGDPALRDEVFTATGVDPAQVESVSNELTIDGAVDFDCAFTLAEGEELADARYHLYLRENDLRHVDGFRLDGLSGVLKIVGDEVKIPMLAAQLDDTPVTLLDVVARIDGELVRLDADLEAEEFAIDRELLTRFLAEEEVTALIDEFSWRGELDVDRGHLTLTRRPDRPLEVALRGEGTLSDAFVEFGFPLSIRSARVTLEELVFDGDNVRGWGRMHDLYGQVLDRNLGGADTVISYYGSRITMESLSGSFCKGWIGGLGRDEDSAPAWRGPVFSVDLAPPFEFQANVAVDDVDVGVLLEDVFASDAIDRGYLSSELQLQGELQDLLSIRGSGRGDIRETILWSVPVVRDLFSQLGFDATAVFDSMHTDLRVEDGNVYMEGIEVHSPLLRLRGRGVLGLDGTLHHDLEVKYSLVDKIGPLRSLVYLLQNTLLSVAIRGDMSRPKVFLSGALTGAFTGVDEGYRALPLPALSPLPDRF